ncbi:hypothetical protein LTR94_024082 [Friedmanniomyces endolithicus]|nr:hypothetical protein LTR94_024082 [Friedmanniomyces endolithicus]
MSNPNAHDIKVLNCLIETAQDSADGYREAAEDSRDPRYRSLFERRSFERRQVVDELSGAVRGLGGDPSAHGSFLAKAQRAFLDMKHALMRDEDVTDSIASGEGLIASRFEKALEDSDISATTRETIRRAYASVRPGHEAMEELKHSLEGQRDASNPLFPQ